MNLILLALFGALGVLTRYGITVLFTKFATFPLGAFSANLVGSFLAGFLFFLFQTKSSLNPSIQMAILVGFLGGLTTFSTFSLETLTLFQKGFRTESFLYFALTPLLGVSFCYLGYRLALSFYPSA